MAGAYGQRKPAFVWQAFLILLPVAALAVFGLFSLRQDRLLAERNAQEQAHTLAQLFAHDCQLRLNRDISRFVQTAERQRNSLARQARARPKSKTSTNGRVPATNRSTAFDINPEPLPRVLCIVGKTRLFSPPDYPTAP